MNGLSKKIFLYEAGVLITTILIFSFSSSANIANLFENKQINTIVEENFYKTISQKKLPPIYPMDIPWINLGGPYEVKGTDMLVLEFSILYGTPRYNVTINWGDGSSPENTTTNTGYVLTVHKYGTPREDPYKLQVWVEDSKGDQARDETNVSVKGSEGDLYVTLRDQSGPDGPFHCESETINFEITIQSSRDPDYSTCEEFIVELKIASSCETTQTQHEGPIAVGNTYPIIIPCCEACGPGSHTATVTIIPIGINDINLQNNVDTHQFKIYSEEVCFVLNKMYSFFSRNFHFSPK